MLVATVGNLDPEAPGFEEELHRLRANPLFRGIRYGNLWGRGLAEAVSRPLFLKGLKAVEQAGLAFDTANPDPPLLLAVLRIAQECPALRIVIDHLPHAVHSIGRSTLQQLEQCRNVHVKVSEVLDPGHLDLEYYRPRLDLLWDTFGEDRLLFGSDWPNWDTVATLAQIVDLARQYVLPKGPATAEKFFSANARRVYGVT